MSFLKAWLPRKWQTLDKRDEYEKAVQVLFNTREGRFVLDCWLDDTYCSVSHVPGDAYSTAYNEGQRAFIHAILETLKRAESKQTEAKIDDGGSGTIID